MRNPTRSTIARIIAQGQATGDLPAGTTPVGMAAYVRGYQRTDPEPHVPEWVRRALSRTLPAKELTA